MTSNDMTALLFFYGVPKMYSNFLLHKNKRMFTNIVTSVHFEPYTCHMLKQNKLEHLANKLNTITYTLDTLCACIRSVSRNTDSQLQSDAKEPILLIKLPTFISSIPWHVIY